MYILMNAFKNFTTIPLQLNEIYLGSCNTLTDLSNKVRIPNKTAFKSMRVQLDYRYK